MRIGIDACCWSNKRGFGRYTREVVREMHRQAGTKELTLVVDRQTAEESRFPEPSEIVVVDTREQATRAASASSARRPADLWRMARAVSRLKLDLFFFPAVYSYFPIPGRIPTVVTFHDAIAESYPSLIFSSVRSRWLWAAKVRLALWQADRIVTVSETARQQIASVFGYPSSSIAVVPEGPAPEFRVLENRSSLEGVLRRYDLPAGTPLILYVGGVSPHKNLAGLLRALARLSGTSSASWHLGIVGDYENDSFLGCHRELRDLAGELGLTERVTFTGFVPNEELVSLYNAGCFLVLPSFCEGFGLPVVEAMACGLPVAASRAGALPEVIGSAGALFDPENVDEMASVMEELLKSPSRREQLRRAGFERVQRYSWSSAARQTLRLFEETVGGAAGGGN
jgi:glycosyltransferase involved in cell wall biosynthesis